MAEITPNYGLTKPDKTDFVNIEDLNGNMDVIDTTLKGHNEAIGEVSSQLAQIADDYTKQVPYAGITGGIVNTYTISAPAITELVAGMAVCIKVHAASTGTSTLNWGGKGAKPIKKASGADVTNLKTNGVYTLRYDGSSFILQGEGASGNAVASDLLSGKTATTDAGEITGSVPDIGPSASETINLTSEGAEYTIAYGRHSGLRKIKVAITNLVASVIKAGATVGGIPGNFTADATATPPYIVSGKSAYVNGAKVDGNIPDYRAAWQIATSVQQADGRLHMYPPYGVYTPDNGTGVYYDSPDFLSANILSGKNIFGKVGTAVQGKRFASGAVTSSAGTVGFTMIDGTTNVQFYTISVSGLTFLPSLVYALYNASGSTYSVLYTVLDTQKYPKCAYTALHYSGNTNTSNYAVKGDVSPAYVNSAGFTLPVKIGNGTFTWIAIE